jgi:hypothetical protein
VVSVVASAAAGRGDGVAVGEALQRPEERSDKIEAGLQRYGFEECVRAD